MAPMHFRSPCGDPAQPVSIIVRTQGRRAELLRAALASVVAQTHRPLELLVVEDGGNALGPMVAAVAAPDVEIRHLPIPKGGRSRAGNIGILAASAPYVGFLDDDDELLPHHAEVLSAALYGDKDEEAPVAYALAEEVLADRDGRIAWGFCNRRHVGLVPFSRARLWLGNFLPIQAALVRRQKIVAAGGFDETLDLLEDWDLWLRLSEAGRFIAVEDVTSRFRTPASRRDRRARAASHDVARSLVVAKHARLHAEFTLGDLLLMHELMRHERPGWPGIRNCARRFAQRVGLCLRQSLLSRGRGFCPAIW